ncbi:MAG: ribosome recycling factor [Patescibacteria group bacterium]|nr:ribosome recycling factor [Patescibacteria group bacterium]
MDEALFLKTSTKMGEVVDLVFKDLLNIQTGRAKPAMVEDIKVEAYEGSYMNLKELASISASDSHSIVIKPWDSSVIKKIEAGILKSELNLSPVVDGEVVRINIPLLNEERRTELTKIIKQKIEAGKAMLRQVRIEMKKQIDNQKDEAGVSEDDIHKMQDRLQKLMDDYNKKLDEMEKAKEKELMTL